LFVNTLFYFFYFAPNKSTKANQMLDQLLRFVCQRLFYLSIPIFLKTIYPKTKVTAVLS